MGKTSLSPFDALERAILAGRMGSFRHQLEQAIEVSQGRKEVVWPDHALIMVVLAGPNGVGIDIQRQMLAALMATPFPPSPVANPNPISEAIRIRSVLLDDLLAAGFTLMQPTQSDNKALIERLAEGNADPVNKVAPGLLLAPKHCDALLANLLDINRKPDKPSLLDTRGNQGRALRKVLTMAVCQDIQAITAGRMLPQFRHNPDGSHTCLWWPITDRLEQHPHLWAGLDLLIQHQWLTPVALRRHQATSPSAFEPFMREVEQRALEAGTRHVQGHIRGARL